MAKTWQFSWTNSKKQNVVNPFARWGYTKGVSSGGGAAGGSSGGSNKSAKGKNHKKGRNGNGNILVKQYNELVERERARREAAIARDASGTGINWMAVEIPTEEKVVSPPVTLYDQSRGRSPALSL